MLALHINKYITSIISQVEEITSLVPATNIQPLVLEPTNFPFISFARLSSTTEYNKGRYFGDEITHDIADVEFAIVAENYSTSISIAVALRAALECKTFYFEEDNVRIHDIKLLATSEQKDNVYVQYMLFSFTIDKLD